TLRDTPVNSREPAARLQEWPVSQRERIVIEESPAVWPLSRKLSGLRRCAVAPLRRCAVAPLRTSCVELRSIILQRMLEYRNGFGESSTNYVLSRRNVRCGTNSHNAAGY